MAIYINAAQSIDKIKDTASEQRKIAASNTSLEAKTDIADRRHGNSAETAIGGTYPKICDMQSKDIRKATE